MERLMESQAPDGFPDDLDEIAKLYSNCFLSFRETNLDSTKNIEEEIDARSPWFNSASTFFSRVMKSWYRILIEITLTGALELAAENKDLPEGSKDNIWKLYEKVKKEHNKTPESKHDIFKANQWWAKVTSDYNNELNLVLERKYPQLDLKIDSFTKSRHVDFRNVFEHYEDKGREHTDAVMKDRMLDFLADPLKHIADVETIFVKFCSSIFGSIEIDDYNALVEKYKVSKHNMNTAHKKQAVLEM